MLQFKHLPFLLKIFALKNINKLILADKLSIFADGKIIHAHKPS